MMWVENVHESRTYDAHEYREGLSGGELLGELKRLLGEERAVMRLSCRYLADLEDVSEQARESDEAHVFAGYADVFHLARCELKMGRRRTQERIRIGRALRELPMLESAYLSGDLCYSRVREVTRVARPETEAEWLKAAQELDMRALERRVVAARQEASRSPDDHRGREGDPAELHYLTPDTVSFQVTLPGEVAALLQRAMEGARRACEGSVSDAEALMAVARDALAAQSGEDLDFRRMVVLYECKRCQQVELETGAEPAELSAGSAATLGCGATELDLATAGREVKRGGTMPVSVRRAVMARDRGRCRVPGCHLRRYVDVHHLAAQSAGGEHSRHNCVTLCTRHHQWLHEGKIHIEGDADSELVVRNDRGEVMRDPWAPARSARRPPAESVEFRLLDTMGRRGGWSADDLCDATQLPASKVTSALLMLELDGRVIQRNGRYDPSLVGESEPRPPEASTPSKPPPSTRPPPSAGPSRWHDRQTNDAQSTSPASSLPRPSKMPVPRHWPQAPQGRPRPGEKRTHSPSSREPRRSQRTRAVDVGASLEPP